MAFSGHRGESGYQWRPEGLCVCEFHFFFALMTQRGKETLRNIKLMMFWGHETKQLFNNATWINHSSFNLVIVSLFCPMAENTWGYSYQSVTLSIQYSPWDLANPSNTQVMPLGVFGSLTFVFFCSFDGRFSQGIIWNEWHDELHYCVYFLTGKACVHENSLILILPRPRSLISW